MVERWVVLGGWAVDAAVLAPIFPSSAILINSCSVIPRLLDNNVLRIDWKEALIERCGLPFPLGRCGIAGWSTGAMLAYTLARATHPAACVLISATPSFCRTKDFPFGHKPSVVRAMREGVRHAPDNTVNAFRAKCGLPRVTTPVQAAPLPYGNLIAGLHFLEQAALFPLDRLPCPTLVLHGSEDAIVPVRAGCFLSERINGTFALFEGPHAFFHAQDGPVRHTIERFVERAPS
ncbi:MAG: alpha/beta fold hydrolase [Chitinispirillaceae bacterium]|nr:alpha/beta fold hydrolase [Chitinispirillaceae bacterium]